jgi:hypothetical protein
MKTWKIAAAGATAIFFVLLIFIVAAYSPMTIYVIRTSAPIDDQYHYSLVITGHLPGQSLKTFYFAVREYVSGVEMGGYGSGTNDSAIQTDLFGNFKMEYPRVVTITDNSLIVKVMLVSESGIMIEKMVNVPLYGTS